MLRWLIRGEKKTNNLRRMDLKNLFHLRTSTKNPNYKNKINKVLRNNEKKLRILAKITPRQNIKNVIKSILPPSPQKKYVPLSAMLDPYSKKVTIKNLQNMSKITGNKKYINIAHERALTALNIIPNVKKIYDKKRLFNTINKNGIYVVVRNRTSGNPESAFFNTKNKNNGIVAVIKTPTSIRVIKNSQRSTGEQINYSNKNAKNIWNRVLKRVSMNTMYYPILPRNLEWVKLGSRYEAFNNKGTMYTYFPNKRQMRINPLTGPIQTIRNVNRV
jgi:hypothetical protein